MATALKFIRSYPWVAATIAVGAVGLTLHATSQHAPATWLVGGWAMLIAAWESIGMVREMIRGHFGLDILAVTAIVATVLVGDVWAALVVVLMLTGGEALEDFAAERARRELTDLLARTPHQAHLVNADGTVSEILTDEVQIGHTLLVKPGETVPVDALLLDADGVFDESSLTGESLPVTRLAGEAVLSGSVNGNAVVHVEATALASDSQYQQIVALVQAASDSRAPFVRLADRYAVPFTVLAYVIAGIAWWASGNPQHFAEVLVVATPCPLLIAAPVAFIGGMSRAAKHGIIVKSGGTLEQLARIQTAAFDKTGTLTHGRPVVEHTELFADSPVTSADELLQLAAAAEALSPHVLAQAIVAAARTVPTATSATEDPGHGVIAEVLGRQVVVGKASYIEAKSRPFERMPLQPGQMSVYVAVDGRPAGQIMLRDQLRDNAQRTLAELRQLGVAHTVMLTGDAQATAEHIAAELGMTDVRSSLLPADKVKAVASFAARPVMMVGDGVNDAPVLAAADVGVAMGAKGATAASESADVVIMVDDLAKSAQSMLIAKRTISIALQSIWIGIIISVALMVIAAFGVIPAIIGALLQELVDLVSILNSLRAVRDPKSTR